MLNIAKATSMSWSRLTAGLCAALALTLGTVVLVGWATHSAVLIQVALHFPPMQRNTAVSFALSGLAILGLVMNHPRLTMYCAGIVGTVAGLSLLEDLLRVDFGIDQLLGVAYVNTQVSVPGRMSPATAICFLLIAMGAVLTRLQPSNKRTSVVGISGVVVAAVGVTCCVSALSGTSDAFSWGNLNRVAVHTGIGFVLLGASATCVAWDISQNAVSEPVWLPISASLFVAIFRVGLWQAFSVRNHSKTDLLSTLTLLGGLSSAVLFGVVVHLVLKGNLQREVLRCANRRLEEEVTERQRAEAAALAANRAKSEFLANMSHDIRTPMTGVLGMIDLVLSAKLSLRQAEYLGMARSSADSVLSLLNDILDFSKIEAGRLDIAAVPFSVRQWVNEVTRMFDVQVHQKGLDFITEVGPDVPDALIGDTLRLRQVLVNLVGNAVKFTDSGHISVRVGLEAQTSSDVVILVQVTDSGIGISPEKHRMIFDPFSQADGSAARKCSGTGLGLAISAHLVQLMGGRIGVTSALGRGSTFSFSVRLARAAAEASAQLAQGSRPEAAERAPVGPPKHSLRILVAEDNVVNQKLVAEVLKRRGHQVSVVGNGREAVDAVNESTFDVVLMDVQMPVMDGFAATGAIRQTDRDAIQRTPIMAMTANAMKGDQQKCIQAGMDGYLSKPIDFADLIEIVEKWTPKALPSATSSVPMRSAAKFATSDNRTPSRN